MTGAALMVSLVLVVSLMDFMVYFPFLPHMGVDTSANCADGGRREFGAAGFACRAFSGRMYMIAHFAKYGNVFQHFKATR